MKPFQKSRLAGRKGSSLIAHNLKAVFDSVPDALLVFDRRGRLLAFNPAAEIALGESLEPYLGRSLMQWYRQTHADRLRDLLGLSRAQLRQHVLEVLTHPGQTMRRQFQQMRNGTAHYIDEIGSLLVDDQGATLGWLVAWRDSTEAQRLNALRQELNSMVIHDLRNPITSIVSGLTMLQDLLNEGERNPKVLGEVAKIARNSAENMLKLVQSLLDVSQLEQNALALDCEGMALSEIVAQATTVVLGLAMASGIGISTDLPHSLPAVWIDQEKIQRVLVNLLDNALRHTPTGGQITIKAQPFMQEEAVIVCVEDTGPGIPPTERDRVFDKFAQLNQIAQRGHKGTGLGLTFCRLAVEAHGGRIWVEDGYAGGAAFCFTLPVAPTLS